MYLPLLSGGVVCEDGLDFLEVVDTESSGPAIFLTSLDYPKALEYILSLSEDIDVHSNVF